VGWDSSTGAVRSHAHACRGLGRITRNLSLHERETAGHRISRIPWRARSDRHGIRLMRSSLIDPYSNGAISGACIMPDPTIGQPPLGVCVADFDHRLRRAGLVYRPAR
jgi:hypothetical protein